MPRTRVRRFVATMLCAVSAACLQQAPASAADPPTVYGQYPGRDQFSPLAQINADNVRRLSLAWTYDTGEKSRRFEATPIVVGNVMYFPTPDCKVIALDALTGRKMWEYDPHVRYSRDRSRGVAYWPGDTKVPPRILFGTADGRLIALDPWSGRPVAGFGDQGEVDVRQTALRKFPQSPFWYSSTPAVWQDELMVERAPANSPHGPHRLTLASQAGSPRGRRIRVGASPRPATSSSSAPLWMGDSAPSMPSTAGSCGRIAWMASPFRPR